MEKKNDIKVIIGLGNPGPQYRNNRHNIGFHVVDVLAEKYNGQWKEKGNCLSAAIRIDDITLHLIKPQTFMNDSGKVISALQKNGVTPEQLVVVHDELEKPFGTVTTRFGGSHKGHNGLKSIIAQWGPDFWRIRFGIGRPQNQDEVGAYVLSNFDESEVERDRLIEQAIISIEELIQV